MSRVGKSPVEVPNDVDVTIVNDVLTAKGKLGEQSVPLGADVMVDFADGVITVKPANESSHSRAMWGTVRSLINNVVVGVSSGFNVKMDIIGVGYRAAVSGKTLNLQVGHSHEILYPIPEGISIECERHKYRSAVQIGNASDKWRARYVPFGSRSHIRAKALGMKTNI